MQVYPENLTDQLGSLTRIGSCGGQNGLGVAAEFKCGCFVRSSIEIDDETRSVTDARFVSNGCGYMVGSAETLCAKFIGLTLDSLSGLVYEDLTRAIEAKLGKIVSDRRGCIEASIEALKNAFADHRRALIDESVFGEPLLCTCFGVPVSVVEKFIGEEKSVSVAEVIDACRAGGGCGSCQPIIQELIDHRSRQ